MVIPLHCFQCHFERFQNSIELLTSVLDIWVLHKLMLKKQSTRSLHVQNGLFQKCTVCTITPLLINVYFPPMCQSQQSYLVGFIPQDLDSSLGDCWFGSLQTRGWVQCRVREGTLWWLWEDQKAEGLRGGHREDGLSLIGALVQLSIEGLQKGKGPCPWQS